MLSPILSNKDDEVSTVPHFVLSLDLACQSNRYDSRRPLTPGKVPRTWAVAYCYLLASFSDFVARPCPRRQTTKAHLDPPGGSLVVVAVRLHGLVQASLSCLLQNHAGGLSLPVGVDAVIDRVA